MTTEAWSTRVRHDSDATYQEWRDEFITKLGLMVAGGGLAADETNITPGVGARPGTNTEGGYAVYHLDDPLHATAPIYIRFAFGTHGAATNPRVQVTTGTSTNGSGVLGGTALSTIASMNGSSSQVTDTARASYMSCVDGFFGLSWKIGAGSSEGGFFICRTCDSTGAPTALGALAHWGSGSTSSITKRQAFRYTSPAEAYTLQSGAADSLLGFMPQSRTSSDVSGDTQAVLAWTITPRVEPLFAICGVFPTEHPTGSTFSATLVGNTARTFIVWGQASIGHYNAIAGGSNPLCAAMVWE
jgi:hypothetical protein